MQIGPYKLENPLILAPMAGVTDRPFRLLCRRMGAALAVSEMVTSRKHLWHSKKTRLRLDHSGEDTPRSIQIAGADPYQMAEAARFNVDNGAQIIDINMGCPAKKVCHVAAGSALMKDEALVARILESVVDAVDAPVTLKIRTGWSPEHRNAIRIARIAESSGIQAIAVHGRTRACAFKGEAEYDTVTAVKSSVKIPVIANGDIDSAEKAAMVLKRTGADAIMIGRAAQGRPWVFKEINHYLTHGKHVTGLQENFKNCILLEHLNALYTFYGEATGVRIARKHIGWYCKAMFWKDQADTELFRKKVNQVDSAEQQLQQVSEFFQSNLKGRLVA